VASIIYCLLGYLIQEEGTKKKRGGGKKILGGRGANISAPSFVGVTFTRKEKEKKEERRGGGGSVRRRVLS